MGRSYREYVPKVEVASYIYRAVDGSKLRMKIRYEDKSFAWYEHGESEVHGRIQGVWLYGSQHTTDTLFHLEKLAKQRPATIVIVEAEKDAVNTTKHLKLL